MEDSSMKSKKWLWPVLAVLMMMTVSTANAQFRFGIKGGLNISKVSFNENVIATDNITGFHIGPMIEFMPGGVGVDLGIIYSQKGFKSKDNNNGFVSNYIEVPANLKIKLGLPLVAPYIAAGPYVSFLVGGDKEIAPRENISTQLKTKSFGTGLNFTIGAEVFNHLQVGLTYNWGLTDNYSKFDANDPGEYHGKPHTWLISAAVLF
jgi:hypothetical protein